MLKPDREHALPGLVRRCQAGDQAAWARIVDEFRSLVYGVASSAGLDQEDRAEVFQETFVALHRSIDRIENPAALGGWLAVTAGRLAVRLAGTRRAQATTDIEPLAEVLASEDRAADQIASVSLDAEKIRQALEALGGKCSKLLERLYGARGATYEEISEELGMPVGSIGPTRARCLERLKKALESSGFFDGPTYQDGTVPPRTGQGK
ncbi:MAG: RNA polymerase sigma factor [Fimbriimonadaceae bacterium]